MNTGTAKSGLQPDQAEVEGRGAEPVAQDVEHRPDPGLAAADPGHEAVEAVARPSRRRAPTTSSVRLRCWAASPASTTEATVRTAVIDGGGRADPLLLGVGPDVEGAGVDVGAAMVMAPA